MNRNTVTVLLLSLLILSTFQCTSLAQEESEVDTLVVMPLGDSIMNDGRSRGNLWIKLNDDGYIVDYVGSQYQQGIIPDPHHEGVGGATIQDVADKINGLLETYNPEYIVLMIGTNDIAWYFDETGEEIAERHNALIQQIFDNAPHDSLAMMVSNIPPVTPRELQNGPYAGENRADFVEDFNVALQENMEARIEAGENLVFADVFIPMMEDTARYLAADGVHPSEEGYEVIAQVWYEAFLELLKKNSDDGDTLSTSLEPDLKPDSFRLLKNYPNPFNPATTIEYTLEKSGLASLSIYDAVGQKIETLVEAVQPAGTYFLQWNANEMASGVYYCRLKTAGRILTHKMTLIK